MSLMLRKACQPILDESNLQNYHTEIDNDSGDRCLRIVGECGKPLMQINGINFSRAAPTKVEIEYATELLQAFLVKYKNKIDKYVTGLRKNGTEPTDKDVKTYIGYGSIEVAYTDSETVTVTIEIREDGGTKVDVRVNPNDSLITLIDLSNFKHNPKMLVKAKAFAKKLSAWNIESARLQGLQEKLSVCNI